MTTRDFALNGLFVVFVVFAFGLLWFRGLPSGPAFVAALIGSALALFYPFLRDRWRERH